MKSFCVAPVHRLNKLLITNSRRRMRSLMLLAAGWLWATAAAANPVPPTDDAGQVRLLDPVSMVAFENGMRRSPTFRGLVADLQSSDVIVHVVTTLDLPPGVVGTTRFAAERGGWRYVRIHLATSLARKARTAALAHELQHAREIAHSSARSNQAVFSFYSSRGRQSSAMQDGWETAAAEAAERAVWAELGMRPAQSTTDNHH